MSNLQHGFQLLREEEIDELNTTARLYRHAQSGAELLSLSNNDENKVFGVTFRTPPSDSTGIAHIMEHSVLAGSRKYQVKEPFIEMVKGSLQTFLNAFTYPDKTCYPVASQNVQDFYNLIDVYLDAVFHPLLTPHHLQQEGWHYEIDPDKEEIFYKGVVFNEMKGVYSSPEGVLGRYTQRSLFPPDHTYAQDSGGAPEAIPDLTYEQFKEFHETFYHPANSRIFFYGDDDVDERLRLLDEYLSEFEAIEVDSEITAVPLVPEAKQLTYPYAIDDDTPTEEAKYYVDINWLLPEIDDLTEDLALGVLSNVLVGTAGSPLRKALIESGLGEDMMGGRFSRSLRQPMFSVGLKGISAENVEQIEPFILNVLSQLGTQGFEPEAIEAAINTVEFRLREQNTGSFPRGLAVMLSSLSTWLYDGDPLEPLRFEEPLAAIKAHYEADEQYFAQLLQKYVVNNLHRTTVILEPDTAEAERQEAAEKARLEAKQAHMTPAELADIAQTATALRRQQETPDDPAELAKLPMLTLDDLEKEIRTIPIAVSRMQDAEIVYHDLFTNGIIYFSVGLNLRVLPSELLPYVPLFSYALTEMGTESENYVKLTQRIGRTTGGIHPSRYVSAKPEGDEAVAWLSLRGKATMAHGRDMLNIMRDVLLTVKLDNQERFRQMVLEEKASEEGSLIPAGHQVAAGRLAAHFSEAGWVKEQMGGVEYLFFVRRLAEEVENNWPAVLEKLETVRRLLVNRANMLCNITLDAENYAAFQPMLGDFLSAFPTAVVNLQTWTRGTLPPNEGLTIPAQVNYVGKAANLYTLGYDYHGSVSVITNLLNTNYLWERIRMRGGAYGAFAPFNPYTGVFQQVSYRDPNLLPTIEVYDGTAAHLRQLDLSQSDITKAIIGVIGSMDSYQLPDAKGYTSLNRYLLGITDEYRQQKRDEVLGTTLKDIHAFGDLLNAYNEQGIVAVVGSPKAIKEANEVRGGAWLTINKIK